VASSAIYPGTFDPFTNGHEELVRRAAAIFGRVVIAVAASPRKQPLFDLEQRIAFIQEVLSDLPNIEVVGYTGLTVECALAHDTGVILRGLRAVSDFEYEFQLASMNRKLEDRIETVFMTPAEEHMSLSSTLVREIAALGGDVKQFVHAGVNAALLKKFDH
jgi:pantetheine-phosphate adenylyltransferase